MVCDLSKNNLKEKLESYVNALLVKSYNSDPTFDYKKIVDTIYKDVLGKSNDENLALGMAYHVPQMIFDLVADNKKQLGLKNLMKKGYKPELLSADIDILATSIDKIDAIRTVLGKAKKSLDEIETIIANQPAEASTITLGISGTTKTTFVTNLASVAGFFATTQSGAEIDKKTGLPLISKTNEDAAFYQGVLTGILSAKKPDDEETDYSNVSFGGQTGFKGKLVFERSIPGQLREGRNTQQNLTGEKLAFILTDNDGNIVYFDKDNKKADINTGKPIYFLLKSIDKKGAYFASHKEAMKNSMMSTLDKTKMTEEQIEAAEKEVNDKIEKQVEQLEQAKRKIRLGDPVPVDITGGFKGAIQNVDNVVGEEARKEVTKPLSEFNADDNTKNSIVFTAEKVGNTTENIPGIKFPNYDGLISLKNPNKIGERKEDDDILNNIVDILTQDLKVGDKAVPDVDKVANVNQYIPVNAKNYTIGTATKDGKQALNIILDGEPLDLSNREEARKVLKDFLAKNATIHFHKKSYDNNNYEVFTLTPDNGAFNVSKSSKDYYDFISSRMYPRVVRDERTKLPMVLNGYFTFEPLVTKKEIDKAVEEVTEKVEKQDIPVTQKQAEQEYDELLRSRLLESIVTPEQDAAAEAWWNESALSKALDSTGKPLFTLNLLRNVANSEAWASFRDSVITLYEGGNYTHVYHEAWHAFSQTYLSYSDRTKLYKAVSKLPGTFKVAKAIGEGAVELVDVEFSQAERKELEEFIAEEFRKFALNNGKFKTQDTKASIFKRIFDRVWQALKALVGGSTAVNIYSNPGSEGVLGEIFNTLYTAKSQEDLLPYASNIKNGEFGLLNSGVVNTEHPEDQLSLSESLLISKTIDGIISKETTDMVQEGRLSAVSLIFKSPKELKKIYDKALAQLSDKRIELLEKLNSIPESKIVERAVLDNKISVLTRATKSYMYGNITEILEGRNTKGSVIAFHRNNSEFKDMFIKFKISKEEASELDDEELEDNLLGRNYDAGNSSTESEKLANQLTIYIIKSLLKQNKEDGSYVLNELGFPEPIEFKPFWRVMMDKCSGENTVMGLYNKIKEAGTSVSPVFTQLLNKIFTRKKVMDQNGNIIELSEQKSMEAFLTEGSVTGDMWMKLVQSFNLYRIDLTSVNITQTDEGIDVKVGKSTAEYQTIVRNWQSSFQQKESDRHTAKTKDKVNYINVANVIEDYIQKDITQGKKLIVSVNQEDYIPFLNSIGINLSDTQDIRSLIEPNDVKYLAETIVKIDQYLTDLKNNYEGIDKEQKIQDVQKLLSSPIELFRSSKTLPNKVVTTNSGGTINTLAGYEAIFSEEYASGMRLTPDGEKKSVFSLNSTDTQKVRALQKAKQRNYLYSSDADYMHMNYLDPANNPIAAGSVYLKSLFAPSGVRLNNQINIFDLAGSQFLVDKKDESSSVGITYSKMNLTDKFISDFIATLTAGYMQGIVPGDKSSYYAIKLDKIDTYIGKNTNYLFVDISAFLKNKNGDNVAGYDGMDKTIEILYPKLEGEIRRIAMVKADPEYYKNIKGFEKADQFDLFAEMLDSKDNLKEKLASDEFFKKFAESNLSLMDFLNKSENLALKKKIDNNINKYFEQLVKEYDKNLFEKTFGKTDVLPTSINKKIADIILKDLSTDQIELLGSDYNTNIKDAAMMAYAVNNFLHKSETTLLLQGDGFQFDHAKDAMPKRTPGSQSGGRVFAVDNMTQYWVNNKVGRPLEERFIKDGTLKKAKRLFDGTANTAIIKESEVGSVYFDMYRDLFKKDFEKKGLKGDDLIIALYGQDTKTGKIGTGKIKADGTYDTYEGGKMNPFSKIKDGDGQGWITFDSYRILKKIEGMWSDAQESAYMKIVNGEVLGASELSDLFPVYKLQYNGPLVTTPGRLPVQAFHKFSLFPLIPTVIKGKPAEIMHQAMMEQNIDYALFESGSKRSHIKPADGSKGDVIYKNGDTSNIKQASEINFTNNPIYVTYLKNQTDVNSKFKEYSTFSTQMRKLLPAGLYAQGMPIDYKGTKAQWDKLSDAQKRKQSEFHNLTTNFKDSLDRLVYHEYKNLLEDLDWTEEDVEKAIASPEAMKKMIEFLVKELKDQGFSDHEISILQTDSNWQNIDFSISPLAGRFEKLIMSIINTRLIRLKIKGEPLVEVSSALMQNPNFRNATEEEKRKYGIFGTNGLPSYVVDLSGKKNSIGFGFKRALTEMDQNLFKTTYYVKNEQGEYVPALDKNNRKIRIGVYKTITDEEGNETKSLDVKASLDRLNEMLLVTAWKMDDENYKKLRLTGVRIPVQGDNSMEFGEVVEFLSPDAGPIIIIPAEIVAKSGTDFDVDKMTTYLPYITRTGKLLKDNASEEELEKRIETLKKKVDTYKKNKEVIKLFKDEKSARWLDIGPSFNKFRKAVLQGVRSNPNVSERQIEALTGKNREIIKTLETPGMEKLLKGFKKAYKIYTEEIKGVTLENIKNVEEGLKKLYDEQSELSDVYDQLSDAQEHKNNYIAGIQNRLIDDIVNILQLPAKAASLLSPNDTNIAKPIAEKMKGFIQKSDNETDFSKSLLTGTKEAKGINPGAVYREDYNNKKQQEFTVSKGSLGIAAVDNYINILLNQAGGKMKEKMLKSGFVFSKKKFQSSLNAYIKNNKVEPEGQDLEDIYKKSYVFSSEAYVPIDLKLKTNKIDGVISLSHVLDKNNVHNIADVINQLMNGFVDAANDSWVAYLQGNLDVVPKILFMLEAGVPIEDVGAFVNNPISRAYVAEKNKQKSVFSKLIYGYQHVPGDAKKSARANILDKINEKFDLTKLSLDVQANLTNTEDGSGNIHGFYGALEEIYMPGYFDTENLDKVASQTVDYSNPEQIAGFLQFLYIEELINDYDNMKKAFNPDTKKVSDLFSSQAKIEEVNAIATTGSLDFDIYDFVRYKSIIAPFFIQDLARKLFSRLFKLRDNSTVNKFLLNKTKNFTEISEIKKTTGYDVETYVIKFKNFLAQYIFANELRQYDPKSKTYKGRPISQAFLDQANKDFDEENYSIYSKSPDSYRNRGLAAINPAAFQFSRGTEKGEEFKKASAKVRQDFIEFNLEREYLRRTVPMSSIENSKEFRLRKVRLLEGGLGMYQKTSSETEEEYTERLNKMTYEDYLANQALKNTYNIWQLFRSGDNTIARELMDIIQNYKEIGDNTNYSILQQFASVGVYNRGDLNGVQNFQLKNYSNLDEGLITDYYNQWSNLANPGKFKILGEDAAATKANAYISNFFAKLPIYAFLQSGMESGQFSLASVMPYEKYREIMERGSTNFLQRLEKEDANKILGGINSLFVIENSANRSKKPLRNRGLLVKQPTLNLPVSSNNLYEQPFLKEVEPGIFEMDTFTMNGRTVTMDAEDPYITNLRNANKDTIFLITPSDLFKYQNKELTVNEADQAIGNYKIATDILRSSTGKKIVVNVQNFGGRQATEPVAETQPLTPVKPVTNPKIISDGDLAAFKFEVDKNKGKMPVEFYTNNNASKWLLNSKNLYDLVDKITGEIYLRDVNLETGVSEAPVRTITTPSVQPSVTQLQSSVSQVKAGVSELFESNPELADDVYEALGYFKSTQQRFETPEEFEKRTGRRMKMWEYMKNIAPNDREITEEQHQKALQFYSQYIDTTTTPTIKGFKEFVKSLQAPTSTTRKTYSGKVTSLQPNQIFVFGSNPLGINGNPAKGTGGAALVAYNIAGVKQGEKMNNKLSDSGKAWGITTVTAPGKKRSKTPQEITEGIKKLYEFAKQNPTKEFLVSDYSATNLNGYTGQEMADMFNAAGPIPSNIVFNENFDKLLPTTQPKAPVTTAETARTIYDKINKDKKTKSANVEIAGQGDLSDVKYDGKTFWSEVVPEARAQFGDQLVIAYRGKRTNTFLQNYKGRLSGDPVLTIGNPFDWQVETGTREEQGIKSTKRFIHWMITGDNMGVKEATAEYRQAIIDDIKNGKLKNRPIIYYQEKGYATHATALDYLINKYDWSKSQAPIIEPEQTSTTKTPEVGDVVEYKENAYILWNINDSGKAQLTAADGTKFSGTPEMNKLRYIKSLPKVEFNNKMFVVDSKDRIFSLSSGSEVYKNATERPQILAKVKKQPTQAPVSTSKELTEAEADWMYNNIKLITSKYKSKTIADSVDFILKEPIKTKISTITAIDVSAGNTSTIWFETEIAKGMVKISLDKAPRLYKMDEDGKYYAVKISENKEAETIESLRLLPTINAIKKDTNVKQPETRRDQFEMRNKLQQKYGLSRTYKDIVNELMPKAQPQTSIQQSTDGIEPGIMLKKQDMLKKINNAITDIKLDQLLAEKGYDVKDIISNLQAAKTQEDLNKINKILDKLC